MEENKLSGTTLFAIMFLQNYFIAFLIKEMQPGEQLFLQITNQIRYQPRFLCSPRPNRADLGPLPPITHGSLQIQEKTQGAPGRVYETQMTLTIR